MKVGILGTGDVGKSLGAALVHRGHDIVMGTRDVRKKLEEKAAEDSISFREWLSKNKKIHLGTFEEAAAHGEVLVNATAGHGSLEAMAKIKPAEVKDKILIDVANALTPWGRGPVEMFVANTDSLAERIQRAHPGLRVVKAMNTVSPHLMVNPAGLAGGDHDVFVAGNDPGARERVTRFLREEFGWRTVVDFGDLTGARAMEMMVMAWVKVWESLGTADFNFKVVR